MDLNFQVIQETEIHEFVAPKTKSKNSVSTKEARQTLKVLSLFSGCGGMDLGFEGGFKVFAKSINPKLQAHFIAKKIGAEILLKRTRFETVFANDILPDAKKAWVNYFSKRGRDPLSFNSNSIVDLVKYYRQDLNVFPENIDVVTGGFPCQDFSVAGKRNGFKSHKDHNGKAWNHNYASEETRGKLYMWMKEVIEITKPKIFVAENVKGLVNLSNVKDIIQADFASAGYFVLNPQVLHAADYGVPQSRERVIFIGIRKDALNSLAVKELTKSIIGEKYNPYPKPSHAFNTQGKDLCKPVMLKDFFKHVPEPSDSNDLSQKYFSKAKYMGKHCQGQTEIKLEGIAPTIRAEHHGNIEFRRLSKKHGGKISEELNKGLKERRLTPRECAIAQTFPMDYEFVIPNPSGRTGSFLVSPSMAYKIIGNAVPPLLGYNIAKRLEEVWDLYFKK